MSQNEDFTIRAVPRSNEKKTAVRKTRPRRRAPRWLVYGGALSFALLATAFLLPAPDSPSAVNEAHQETAMASVASPEDAAIRRHLEDAMLKREMLVQKRAMENLEMGDVKGAALSAGFGHDSSRTYGVQLDQEDVSERLFEELQMHDEGFADATPEDRINNRLANRKWLNEFERAQRIQFVRNFIKSAYDRGYKVELDGNLVVVGVRRISRTEKLDINEVLDRLAKQGL